MKNAIYVCAVLVVLYIVVVLVTKCSTSIYKKSSLWPEVEGVLTRQSMGKSSHTDFEYFYNGKKYNGPSSGGDAITAYKTVLGEVYILRVNPQKPEQYTIQSWRVGFKAGEKVDSVIGKIKLVGEWHPFGKTLREMEFEYNAYGTIYTRKQKISPYDTVDFPKLENGQCYPVVFWQENPQRAVMYFNRPAVNCE